MRIQYADGNTMRQPDAYPPNLRSSNAQVMARERQDLSVALLSEQLEHVLDEVIALRLADKAPAATSKLDVLFELYEDELLRKDQVRQRAGLDPAQFHEELRAYRRRAASR